MEELLKACRRAFHYFSCKATDDDEAAKVPLPFQAAHATLQVMQAITTVAITISQSGEPSSLSPREKNRGIRIVSVGHAVACGVFACPLTPPPVSGAPLTAEGLSAKSTKAVRRLSARVATGAEAMMRRSWAAGGSVGGTVSEVRGVTGECGEW